MSGCSAGAFYGLLQRASLYSPEAERQSYLSSPSGARASSGLPRHPRVLSALLGSVVLTLGRVQLDQAGVQEVVGELVSSEGEGPVPLQVRP